VKGSIIFGEGAVITSDVEGDTVVVGGKVTGKIVAHQKIQLLRTSVFTGDLITPSLLIEYGAQINGSCKKNSSSDSTHQIYEEEVL
jgi:cytoskeletal protein CcmA (bactofilin family)